MAGRFDQLDDYEFNHLVGSLADLHNTEPIHTIFSLEEPSGQNAWFMQRDAHQQIRGYSADLDVARGIGDEAGSRSAKAAHLPLRYALIDVTTRDLASNLKPGLAARLMTSGLWTRDNALAWAALAPDPSQTVDLISQSLKTTKGRDHVELGALVLDTAARISDPDNRVLKIAKLAPDLPEELLPRALGIIADCENEGSRSGGLRVIAKHLPDDLKREVLGHASEINQVDIAAKALVELAPLLAEPDRTTALSEALRRFAELVEPSTQPDPFSSHIETANRILGKVPRDWLKRFADAARRDGALPKAAFLRECEADPDTAKAVLEEEDVRDRLMWQAVARGYIANGQPDAALSVLSRGTSGGGGLDVKLIKDLLRGLTEPAHDTLFEIIGELYSFDRQTLLDCLHGDETVPTSSLIRLADMTDHDRERHKGHAMLAGRLDGKARARLLDEVFADDNVMDSTLALLAPHMSLAQLHRAANAILRSGSVDQSALGAIAEEMVAKDRTEEALAIVESAPRVLSFIHGELLAKLARVVPDDRLGNLRAAVRLSDCTRDRVRARSALVASLPSSVQAEIFAEAMELGNDRDRLEAMADIAMRLPPLIEFAGPLHTELITLLENHDQRVSGPFGAGIAALGHVACDTMGTGTDARRLRADLEAQGLTPPDVMGALLPLAAEGAVGAEDAMAEVFAILSEYPNCAPDLGNRLRPHHASALEAQIRCYLEDRPPSDLIPALAADISVHLPMDLRVQIAESVCCLPEADQRIFGLHIIIQHLPRRLAKRIASAELSNPELPFKDDYLQLLALSALGHFAPECNAPHLKGLSTILDGLPAAKSLPLMPPLLDHFAETRSHLLLLIERLFEEEADELWVLYAVAPWIDTETALSILASIPFELDNARAHGTLIARLKPNDAVQALEAIENRTEREAVIEAAVPNLSLEVLRRFNLDDLQIDALALVAKSAAAQGDTDFAISILRRFSSASGLKKTLAAICRVVPRVDLDRVIDEFRRFHPSDRVDALITAVVRLPRRARRPHLRGLLEDIGTLQGAQTKRRKALLSAVSNDLARLPIHELLAAWVAAMRRATTHEDVLVDLAGFAPALIAKFGEEIAQNLDAEITNFAKPRWP